jgi:Antirepressor regulating drug resistance, predicted signal transduction N-terminal membrane component
LYGVFKYSVILPKKSLDAVQLRHSFLHELAHYKHRDNFVKWIVLLALRLHWFNPFVYKAANEIDLLCELRCDESATKCFSESERLDYGKTLLTVASNSLREPFSVFSSFGEDKQNLKERLEVLINMKSKKSSTLFVSFVAIALTAILAVFSLTACKTNTDQKTNINSHSPSNDSTSISKQFEQESTPSSQTVSTVSINPADKKQIIDNVSDELKEKYPDINVTNQWLGNKEENRYTVLFGCLKNDPQQGVAQVILESADGKNILEEKRYLDPMKNGALKVTDLESAKDDFMKIGDSTGKQRSFSCRSGFTLY